MQLVSQKVSALCSTMSIVDSEEGAARPVSRFLKLRLDNIQDDADSVFIVVPYYALMSVCCVRDNHSILL